MIGIMIIALSVNTCSAQSFRIDEKGVITKTAEADKVPDKVYTTIDSTTFYQSKSGAIYYWKVSKKTGKEYKVYVPKKKEEE